jgi:hypothetical protein
MLGAMLRACTRTDVCSRLLANGLFPAVGGQTGSCMQELYVYSTRELSGEYQAPQARAEVTGLTVLRSLRFFCTCTKWYHGPGQT